MKHKGEEACSGDFEWLAEVVQIKFRVVIRSVTSHAGELVPPQQVEWMCSFCTLLLLDSHKLTSIHFCLYVVVC